MNTVTVRSGKKKEIIDITDQMNHFDPTHVGDHILSSLIGPSVLVPAGNQ